ncbi:DDE-type integrase/transposase/recombinase [Rubritalea sp.]|uniref:DDE-type integrase/transposase/recombinase n=1 Tax=Rubritalea sp. TaxID=2109375 RepID=UPI003EF591ED
MRAADEVWCTDVTDIPSPIGHSVMDWHTRAVLSWEVCNTMDTASCLHAITQSLPGKVRKPKIFNTDQASHFSALPC